jgi:nucleotide-binding universal stress UspA family protein
MLAVDVTRRRVSAEHEEADRYLHGIGQRFQAEGIACTERVVEGEAIGEITRYAREHHIDLIAMSTHGRGGLGRLVFGSVADGVLRSAPCPVLVVRSHERHRRRTEELAE